MKFLKLTFKVPSRGLIGLRSKYLTMKKKMWEMSVPFKTLTDVFVINVIKWIDNCYEKRNTLMKLGKIFYLPFLFLFVWFFSQNVSLNPVSKAIKLQSIFKKLALPEINAIKYIWRKNSIKIK